MIERVYSFTLFGKVIQCNLKWTAQVDQTILAVVNNQSRTNGAGTLLPARRRPQGLVVIGVCLSVCLSVRTVFVRKISQERVHGSPPNLVGGSMGEPVEQVQFWC